MTRIAVLLFACVLCACGPANTTKEAPIEVSDAWIAPSPGGVSVAAGYLTIVNHQALADTLLGVNTQRTNAVEVHSMRMEDGMMVMRPAGLVAIPPGGTLTLAPGGMHLMFTGVTRPLVEGETVEITLHFDHGGDIPVEMPVRRPEHQ